MKKTLVIGASDKSERYSNIAIKLLRKNHYEVVAIGKTEGIVEDVRYSGEKTKFTDIDTITLYINPNNQKEYYDYIISLNPRRIIFNPGAENKELQQIAEAHDILTEEACTLVLLNTGQY